MDDTEKESVLAEALGEKAGLWPGGGGRMFYQQVSTAIAMENMNILKILQSMNFHFP